jgi:hypothetical protein
MNESMQLLKYFIGVGDRFSHEAEAQSRSCILAAEQGMDVVPVWNKSNREHLITGSGPPLDAYRSGRCCQEARLDKAPLRGCRSHQPKTYERFVAPYNFFTIDVAVEIGQKSDDANVDGC